jgi:hypothetical protein
MTTNNSLQNKQPHNNRIRDSSGIAIVGANSPLSSRLSGEILGGGPVRAATTRENGDSTDTKLIKG